MGGKSGGGSKTYDYHGTIAGVVCRGPVDELVAIHLDGKHVWPLAPGWNENAVDIALASRSRNANVAALFYTGDLKFGHGVVITVSGCSDASFNTASATVTGAGFDRASGRWWLTYANTGSNVSLTSDTAGRISQAKTYTAGQLVLDQGRVWKCLTGHTASAATRPPHANWSAYSLTRAADSNVSGYTSVTIEKWGVCRFYWGSDTQVADPFLADSAKTNGEVHPTYRGLAYFVFEDFLFGRERQSAPNVEAIVSRKPTQAVITGSPANLDDAQANGAAFLAEAITDPISGAGAPVASLSASTFQSVADYLHTNVAVCGLSPLLLEQTTLRGLAAALFDASDAWLRFNHSSALVEAGVFAHAAAPASYVTLTADQLTTPPTLRATGWTKARTGAVLRFPDRTRSYKESVQTVADLRARTVIGEPRTETLERPWITRRRQVAAQGAEWLRQRGQPSLVGELRVRRGVGLGIRPGDWIRLDVDLEPGGNQSLQFCRVIGRTVPPTGDIALDIEADLTQAPLTYAPAAATPEVPDQPAPEAIGEHRLLECPPLLADGLNNYVLPLAKRPTSAHVGFDVLFDSELDGDVEFTNVGRVPFFAVRANLVANLAVDALSDASELTVDVTPSASVLRISVPTQTDSSFLSETPPMAIGASNDDWLLILAEIDGNGRIAEDAAGLAKVEVLSVVEFTAYGAASPPEFAVHALRARRGTSKVAFTAAAAEVWLIRRESLTPVTHADLAVLRNNRTLGTTPDTGTFRLQPFTAVATRSETDCLDLAFRPAGNSLARPRLSWISPGQTSWPYTFGSSSGGTLRLRGQIDDGDGNLVSYRVSYRKAGDLADTFVDGGKPSSGTQAVFDKTISLTVSGDFTITVEATDGSGLVGRTVVVATVPASGGGGTAAADPTFSPWGYTGPFATLPRNVVISCATSGADITWKITDSFDPGTPTPGSSGWSALTAAPVTVSVGKNKWLHAQARKTGLTNSNVVSDFYEWDAGLN